MDPYIEISGLSKTYKTPAGDFQALRRIDIRFDLGELVAVIGKSGSGKSTFINCISGIDNRTSGSIRIGETRLETLNENQMSDWREGVAARILKNHNVDLEKTRGAIMKELNPDYLIPMHCSGEVFIAIAMQEMGDKVIRSSTGTRFVFGA